MCGIHAINRIVMKTRFTPSRAMIVIIIIIIHYRKTINNFRKLLRNYPFCSRGAVRRVSCYTIIIAAARCLPRDYRVSSICTTRGGCCLRDVCDIRENSVQLLMIRILLNSIKVMFIQVYLYKPWDSNENELE